MMTFKKSERRRAHSQLPGSALSDYLLLQKRPVVTIANSVQRINISSPTIAKSIKYVVRVAIVREAPAKKRRTMFVYGGHSSVLSRGAQTF